MLTDKENKHKIMNPLYFPQWPHRNSENSKNTKIM
jgi:hypothetical protein